MKVLEYATTILSLSAVAAICYMVIDIPTNDASAPVVENVVVVEPQSNKKVDSPVKKSLPKMDREETLAAIEKLNNKISSINNLMLTASPYMQEVYQLEADTASDTIDSMYDTL